MLNTKSFLTVDFGAGSLKVAEFEAGEAGALTLRRYQMKPLGQEGAVESKREAVVLKALQEALAEFGTEVKSVNICAPGFHVFSKFVKLPPVDSGKVTQIIQYEAQQNVPFPLAEVVWDYQILGSTPAGELEVLLVAVKADIVERLYRMTDSVKLNLQLTDVSPAALCNAFRYSYGDLEGCTMLLDIGAKTSNLLFFEKGKVYSRSINLGANSITQDFASEMKLPFAEADKLKIAEGFVSLGGAYEEPDNPNQAAISKIARQFMTRLHIQVNQTLQFYRGQQAGSAPDRLFLCGGASVMPYTAQFFAEKLNVPVEYFNPLRNIQIDPDNDLEELAKVAHGLGEVVGLALRNMAHCPVELNLMPESTLRWQSFNQKKPYFIATVGSLVAVVFAVGLLFGRSAAVKLEELQNTEQNSQPLKTAEQRFNAATRDLEDVQTRLETVQTWVAGRYHWADVCAELQKQLILVERASRAKYGVEVGLWIEELRSLSGRSTAGLFGDEDAGGAGAYSRVDAGPELDPMLSYENYGQQMTGYEQYMRGAEYMDPTDTGTDSGGDTNETSGITLVCRAVSLNSIDSGANPAMAFAVQNALRSSPMFDSEKTSLEGQIEPDDPDGTYTFGLNLVLTKPLEL